MDTTPSSSNTEENRQSQAGKLIAKSDSERRVIGYSLALAVVLLLADQASKLAVEHTFQLRESIPILGDFFQLTYVTNPGAAWGMLAGKMYLLLGLAVVVFFGLLFFFRRIAEGWIERYFAVMMILSGIVGNSIDRIWRGEVVDFLDFNLGFYRWPTFNIADSAICVGVILFLLSSLLRKAPSTQHSGKEPSEK